jgi:Zn-dependent M28 family amino/carboxypeptidase
LLAVVIAGVFMLSACVRGDLEYLAGDATGGRNNNTPGSVLAQDYLLRYLQAWTDGPNAVGVDAGAYRQAFDQGTNIIGVLPGTDLADEYVLVGAHYDGLGMSCRDTRPSDTICNGATDNGTGVVAALAVLRALYFSPEPPRRSVIFAFWDREEDGLRGAAHYVQNPLLPLADTVAYVNLDILGANLRPSLNRTSFAIGAETGGPRLREIVDAAVAPSSVATRQVSVVFGQGRSDHVPFIAAGVPSVFLSDATGPCYHTDADDIAAVDFAKLDEQIGGLTRITRTLATTNDLPSFTTGTPLATYEDAVVLRDAVVRLLDDLDTFTPAQATQILAFHTQLQDMVAAGAAAFDSADVSQLLSIALTAVGYFTTGPCDPFLAQP